MVITRMDMLYIVKDAFKKLDADKQAKLIERDYISRIGENVKIFPITRFRDFCKEQFNGDYLELAMTCKNSWWDYANDSYDWFCWYEKNKVLHFIQDIDYYIKNQTAFFENMVNAKVLAELGIPDSLAGDLLECYKNGTAEVTNPFAE